MFSGIQKKTIIIKIGRFFYGLIRKQKGKHFLWFTMYYAYTRIEAQRVRS